MTNDAVSHVVRQFWEFEQQSRRNGGKRYSVGIGLIHLQMNLFERLPLTNGGAGAFSMRSTKFFADGVAERFDGVFCEDISRLGIWPRLANLFCQRLLTPGDNFRLI